MADRHGVPDDILNKLDRYVRTADDRELYQVNPRYIAAKLGVDTHTALSILACAVQEGLFDLNWEVHCPHCKGKLRTFPILQQGQGEEFCAKCQVNFATHLDHEIRVTFNLSESVRKLSTQESLTADPHPPTFGLELLNVQPFRDLFADQVLPPGESLQIKRIAFLFTDLRGSTAMYARQGDPKAYSRVRDHFQVLFEAATRNQGITVKTIGDAVMASFVSPVDALRAAIEAQQDMQTLNHQLELSDQDALHIRSGTHVGPCISVTLNEKLDYFGATVNIASRISRLSHGGDVVLTPAMLEDETVQRQAAQQGELESFSTALHGYEQSFELKRLVLYHPSD
jgi:class 3 adenylate cyclase